ncbi:F-box only protein 27 [Camelus dromedarius]|uniref:F-box only protein 27 n=1 Tax=Camelus dromedarius TaxID=9838 RepID=A0A5N4DVV9_CAMDR|nr:F-box only protein 27 [Camelus dromedarius]
MGDLSQLPRELLLAVLSHVPPRPLLGRWRPLVDAPAQWLKMLARDHRALPVRHNLLCKRGREKSLQKSMVVPDLDELAVEENWEVMPRTPLQIYFRSPYRWYHKQQQVLDQEEEGFRPELRDSVKIEVSHVFSNLKTGVCFVSLERWVREKEFCSEHYGIYLPDSSVIVQGRLS